MKELAPSTHALLADVLASVDRPIDSADDIHVRGSDPVLPTQLRIGEAAAAALTAGGVLASDLWRMQGGKAQAVSIDIEAAAASLIGFAVLRRAGKAMPRDPDVLAITRFFRTADDSWIHLHGGFPHLRTGLLELLECAGDQGAISRAVSAHRASELEAAIAERGLCGARLRTREEWRTSEPGRAVSASPLVSVERIGDGPPIALPGGESPLAGIRVLDLTRVLAGPTCARTLAAHGAQVLHIRCPDLPFIEPFVMETNPGKRSAYLDLKTEAGRVQLRTLLHKADVFSQGYRGGAMARLNLDPLRMAEARPGLIYVSINCYGHTGPWRDRPGWEQLAQTVSGVAAHEAREGEPALLPAAATDYTTGHLAAVGVMRALARRATEGGSYHVQVSLARTAGWLLDTPSCEGPARGLDPKRLARHGLRTESPFGVLEHLGPILEMSETPPRWTRPAVPLGTDSASWI